MVVVVEAAIVDMGRAAGIEGSVHAMCFNCGEFGHLSSSCNNPKICFICHKTDHGVELCPEWSKTPMTGQYYGSANRGLGFYYIDVAARGNRFSHWSGIDNFGRFKIERGEIDKEGIVGNLKELFDKGWAWHLNKTEEQTYIIRFPPHRKVEKSGYWKGLLLSVEQTQCGGFHKYLEW